MTRLTDDADVAAIDHTYRYLQPSVLEPARTGSHLRLATSTGSEEHPHFFDGRLTEPRRTGQLLRSLANLVGTRFFTPPNMVERLIRQADPVVTAGGGIVRFEVFSECCSTYARVDLTADAYEAEHLSPGTTNVDFNAPMRAALSSLRDDDDVGLSVGSEGLTLRTRDADVVEKRVALPLRWIRGFVEVQGYQAALAPRLTLDGRAAFRLLRSLPRQASKHPTWIVPAGRGARTSQRRSDAGVRVSGTERLRSLEPLCVKADQLQIFGGPDAGASLWELDFGMARITLLLSAEVWRGFSGEGQALARLVRAEPAAIAAVRARLAWQSQLEVDELAKATDLDEGRVRDALAALGARGLVGFDANIGSYFHRELPFDLSAVEALQPRLVAARELVASIDPTTDRRGVERVVRVPGSGATHRVVIGPDGERCSCTWFSRTQGARGPCKHVLAAQIATEGAS